MPVANPVYPQGENRILDLLLYFTQLESQHRVNNLAAKIDSPASLELREKFLASAIDANRKAKDLTINERSTLRYLRHDLRKVRALQIPTLLKRIVYSPWINRQINRIFRRHENYRGHDEWVQLYQQKTALAVNTGNLQAEIRELGIKGQLEEPLKKMMAGNLKEFAFPHYDIHRPNTDFVFHIKKMEGTDAYFLEKFVASHRQTKQEILRGERPETPVVVSLKNEKVFNADEAQILASGKGLAKDPVNAKEWYINTGQPGTTRIIHYDLASELSPFQIPQMAEEPSRSKFLKAIAKGEEMKVTLPTTGENQEMVVQMNWIEKSNPQLQFKSETGEILEPKELQKMIDVQKIASFSPLRSVDNEDSLKTDATISRIASMHDLSTSARSIPPSDAHQGAAEVHARIQLSKEEPVGPYVLRPIRY